MTSRGGLLLMLSILGACKDSKTSSSPDASLPVEDGAPPQVVLTGAAAKGPFILGTVVSVSPVDGAGNTTGQQFTTQTSDEAGNFSVSFAYSGPVQLLANGYYFHEIGGGLSMSPLSLFGMAEITSSGSQNAYINLLSHIAFQRIKSLMVAGSTLTAAVTQADTELYGQLDVGGASFTPGANATQLNLLGGDTPQAAYVFAASAVIEEAAGRSTLGGGLDGQVQVLVNQLQADFAGAGTFTSNDKATLQAGIPCLEPDAVKSSLAKRFAETGSTAVVPNINVALDSDGDGVPNASDSCVLLANPDQSTIPKGVCNYELVMPPWALVPSTSACINFYPDPTRAQYATQAANFDGAGGKDLISPGCTDLFLSPDQGGTFGDAVAVGLPALLGLSSTDQLAVSFLTTADMNGDTKPDLVLQYDVAQMGVPTVAPRFVYLPNDGAGHFGSPVVVSAPTACGGVGTACTTNGECCSDVCMPQLPMPGSKCTSGPPPPASLPIVKDLNGDGIPDLAVVIAGTDKKISTFLSSGSTWVGPVDVALPAGTYDPTTLVAANFRNSVDVDLALSTDGVGVYFLSNDGTGGFTVSSTAWLGLGANVSNLSAADLDADGKVDLIGTTAATPPVLRIVWGDGTLSPAGTASTVSTSSVATSCVQAQSQGCGGPGCGIPFAIGDVDGDGKLDLTLYASAMVPPMIAMNNSNRTFAAPVVLYLAPDATAGHHGFDDLQMIDMNGDGRADLIGSVGNTPMLFLIDQPNHFSW